MRPPHLPLAGERGSGTTEAVLVTPVLLFLVMLIVQFGLWYHAQHVVRAAAEQGARAGRAATATATTGEAEARGFLADAGPRLVERSSVTARRANGDVTVRVTGRVVSVVPGLHLGLRAVVVSPLETFRADTR